MTAFVIVSYIYANGPMVCKYKFTGYINIVAADHTVQLLSFCFILQCSHKYNKLPTAEDLFFSKKNSSFRLFMCLSHMWCTNPMYTHFLYQALAMWIKAICFLLLDHMVQKIIAVLSIHPPTFLTRIRPGLFFANYHKAHFSIIVSIYKQYKEWMILPGMPLTSVLSIFLICPSCYPLTTLYCGCLNKITLQATLK